MKLNARVFAGQVALAAAVLASAVANAVPVVLTQLTGEVGGTPAATAIFAADLSGLGVGNVMSISISDNSGGLGGAGGQFSGFDLDAIKLSNTACATAACAAGAASINVFNFSAAGTVFTPGTQRGVADPKLFGTGAGGNTVDNAVATLGLFDGNSTTAIPGAFGFISMGDNGTLLFTLTSSVSTAGLYLYIGEVGNNGEVAASNIRINEPPRVPEPLSLSLLGLGLISVGFVKRKRAA